MTFTFLARAAPMIVAQQAGRADALVVVADEDDVGLFQMALNNQHDLLTNRVADGAAIFVIDADHLLRMAMLGPADVAFLDGAGPSDVGDDGFVIDAEIGEHLANAAAVVVVADDAGEHDLGAEGSQHGGDARWRRRGVPRGDRPCSRMTGASWLMRSASPQT